MSNDDDEGGNTAGGDARCCRILSFRDFYGAGRIPEGSYYAPNLASPVAWRRLRPSVVKEEPLWGGSVVKEEPFWGGDDVV